MENVVVTLFEVESEAFQAFSELESFPQNEHLKVSEAILVSHIDGSIDVKEEWHYDDFAGEDAIVGGFLGGLVGILGGPVGMLLGYGVGAMVGAATGSLHDNEEDTLVETVSKKLIDGDIAIIALVQEDAEVHFNNFFLPYKVQHMRWSVHDITNEIEAVSEVENDLAHQARIALTKKRKQDYEERRQEVVKGIKENFDRLAKYVTRKK
jgi:uncharacterized membrane protein